MSAFSQLANGSGNNLKRCPFIKTTDIGPELPDVYNANFIQGVIEEYEGGPKCTRPDGQGRTDEDGRGIIETIMS
jgi:hypothetical protein